MSRILLISSKPEWADRLSAALNKRDSGVEIVRLPEKGNPSLEWESCDLCVVESSRLQELALPAHCPDPLPPVFCLVENLPVSTSKGFPGGILEIVANAHLDYDLLATALLYRVENGRLCRQLERLIPELETARRVDEVTGLVRYQYFKDHLEHEIFRSQRYGVPLTVVLFEIDNYDLLKGTEKPVDSDRVLVEISHHVSQSLRNCDVLTSYGSGQFAVLLTDTRLLNGIVVAEKIRRIVDEYLSSSRKTSWIPFLTLSMGVVEYTRELEDITKFLRVADTVLADAKAAGGNCIRVHQASQD